MKRNTKYLIWKNAAITQINLKWMVDITKAEQIEENMQLSLLLLLCILAFTMILYRAEITTARLFSNTFAFFPPQGIRGLWGPFSAGKLFPLLSDREGDPSPRQWAPPQLGPEKVQGSHLVLWAQNDSRRLHQSRRRCALDSQKFPNIALVSKALLPIPLQRS